MKICVDSNHQETQMLLDVLGVSVKANACRYEHYSDAIQYDPKKVSYYALIALAGSVDSALGWRLIISYREASKALSLINSFPKKILPLFDPGRCPGKTAASGDILGNMMGAKLNVMRTVRGVTIENQCPMPSSYSVNELSGIYYTDTMVPNVYRIHGQSVVKIMQRSKDIGSAVIVNMPNGNLMTAHHVCFDSNKSGDTFKRDLNVTIGERIITLDPKFIIRQEPDIDFVLFDIPGINTEFVSKTSIHPPLPGDKLFYVGFPTTLAKEAYVTSRAYTVGYTVYVKSDALVMSNARAASGNSGGAIFNEHWELVGILSFIEGGKNTLFLSEADSSYSFFPSDYFNIGALGKSELLSKILMLRNISLDDWLPLYHTLKKDVPELNAYPRNERETEFLIDFVQQCSFNRVSLEKWPTVYHSVRRFTLSIDADYFLPSHRTSGDVWSKIQGEFQRVINAL